MDKSNDLESMDTSEPVVAPLLETKTKEEKYVSENKKSNDHSYSNYCVKTLMRYMYSKEEGMLCGSLFGVMINDTPDANNKDEKYRVQVRSRYQDKPCVIKVSYGKTGKVKSVQFRADGDIHNLFICQNQDNFYLTPDQDAKVENIVIRKPNVIIAGALEAIDKLWEYERNKAIEDAEKARKEQELAEKLRINPNYKEPIIIDWDKFLAINSQDVTKYKDVLKFSFVGRYDKSKATAFTMPIPAYDYPAPTTNMITAE